MGCGRVGSTLAHILEDQGHSVAVIDQDRDAFRKLGSPFKGKKVTGIGFDQNVLIEAGIEHADAFASVSSGDNSNVLAARVARESFTVRWTADQMLRRLLPEGSEPLWRDPTGRVVLAEVAYAPDWVGEKTSALEEAARVRVGFLSRLGEVVLPAPGTVLQEGDVLHVIALEEDLERISAALSARAPGGKAKGGR